MGFLSGLKNAVTGGAAVVQVQCPPVQRGQVATAVISATAKSSAKVAGIYLQVRAVERANVRDTDYEDGRAKSETVRGTHTSYERKIEVCGAFDMQEGQQGQWPVELHLPIDVGPSLNGKIISHEWAVRAGLDMKGNDPDSGWVPIQVF